MLEYIISHFNYMIVVVILMIGLWAMLSKLNLIKKLIGMGIFQTGIILFYISMGTKRGSTIPILDHHAHHIVAADYANPVHGGPVHS